MKLFRLCLYGVLAGGLLAAAVAFGVAWGEGTGADFWNLPGLLGRIDQLRRHGEELQHRTRHAKERLAVRKEVTNNLIEGRMTVWQAVARFQRLLEEEPELRKNLRMHYRGDTDEERIAQQVLSWAEFTLRAEAPSRTKNVMARLRAQWAAGRDGMGGTADRAVVR